MVVFCFFLLFVSLGLAEQKPVWPSLAVPEAGLKDTKSAALIVSISNYFVLPDIEGANRNASDWQKYLLRVQGVPVQQLRWLQDNEASREKILAAADELKETVGKDGKLWIVFIGHGLFW